MPDQADDIAAGFFDSAGYAKPGAQGAIAAALRRVEARERRRCLLIVEDAEGGGWWMPEAIEDGRLTDQYGRPFDLDPSK